MKYELSEEEIKIIMEMIDITLKAGGLANLSGCEKIIQVLQNPIKEIIKK